MENSSSRDDAVFQLVDTESLKVFHIKMRQQLSESSKFGEDPFLEFVSKVFLSEQVFEVILLHSVDEHLSWFEVGEQFLYIVGRTFTREKLTCRDVEK